MTENALAFETDEDKAHATKFYESKKKLKFKETDGNMKVIAKDDKDVYIHTNHPDAFRNLALGKLHDSDDFHDLQNDWAKNLKNKFIHK